MKVLWMEAFYRGDRIAKSETCFYPYDPKSHIRRAKKFLYWAEADVLIVSNAWGHVDINKCAKEVVSGELVGAGDMKDGAIDGWRSVHFSISTPKDLQPIVRAALEIE